MQPNFVRSHGRDEDAGPDFLAGQPLPRLRGRAFPRLPSCSEGAALAEVTGPGLVKRAAERFAAAAPLMTLFCEARGVHYWSSESRGRRHGAAMIRRCRNPIDTADRYVRHNVRICIEAFPCVKPPSPNCATMPRAISTPLKMR